MKPTAAQLASIRSRPHYSQWWLSIYRPPTVFACRVSAIEFLIYPENSCYRVLYDSVTAGSYLDVQSGMTMYVGTTLGGHDKGRVRVRSAGPATISCAENAHIDFAAGDYLTIVDFFEIWPVYPRLVQDGENVTFYKDWDVAYTDQNEILGSFPCIGPHYAGFIDCNTNVATVYYSSSGTYQVNDVSPTMEWVFEGGDPTGTSDPEPGYVTYDTPGYYTTRVAISASGATEYSYRHVSIYNRPECGTSIPPLEWGILRLDGDRESGGWTGRIWIRETIDYAIDGALVVIFADDEYGDGAGSIGGNANHRDSIVFCGYILDGSIEYNYRESRLEFDIGSPTEIMKRMEGFSISVESKKKPKKWYHLMDMNCRKALYHFLRWHTTALLCNDFEFSGDDRKIQYFDADRSSLYDAIRSFMEGTLRGEVVADRQGKIWAEVSAGATHNAASEFPLAISLTDQDWIGSIGIDERTIPETSYIEMGGIAYSGTQTGTTTALLTSVPGDAPGYGGGVERIQGLALLGQSQLNDLAGDIYAWKNARYSNVSLNIAGNYRIFDLAPQELIYLTVEADDTPRGITWTNKAFVIRTMSLTHDSSKKITLPTLYVHEITSGKAGIAQDIPDIPPDDGFDPPPDTPDLPPPPLPPPTAQTGQMLYVAGSWNPVTSNDLWTPLSILTCYTYSSNMITPFFTINPAGSITITQPGVYLYTFHMRSLDDSVANLSAQLYLCHDFIFKTISHDVLDTDDYHIYTQPAVESDVDSRPSLTFTIPIFKSSAAAVSTNIVMQVRGAGSIYASFSLIALELKALNWNCWNYHFPPGGG